MNTVISVVEAGGVANLHKWFLPEFCFAEKRRFGAKKFRPPLACNFKVYLLFEFMSVSFKRDVVGKLRSSTTKLQIAFFEFGVHSHSFWA